MIGLQGAQLLWATALFLVKGNTNSHPRDISNAVGGNRGQWQYQTPKFGLACRPSFIHSLNLLKITEKNEANYPKVTKERNTRHHRAGYS